MTNQFPGMPEKKTSNKGKGCRCAAYWQGECGCGADWSDNDSYNQALSDVESWLSKGEWVRCPTKDELFKVIWKNWNWPRGKVLDSDKKYTELLAKSIIQHLRGGGG